MAGPAIDPALLAPPSQPTPALNPVNPMDAVGAAIAALQASGAYVGPAGVTSPMPPGPPATGDAGLLDPWATPGAPTSAVAAPAPPLVNSPDYVPLLKDVPDAWQAAVPGGIKTEAYHLPPGTAQGVGVVPSSQAYPRSPKPLDPVSQAKADEEAAFAAMGQTARDAAQADIASQQDLSNRTADAYTQAAHDMEVADSLYQQQREAIQHEADIETNTWLEQYTALAQKEPNPSRWWSSQSGLAKALWGLSMVFGAAHVALTPGAQNVALNMVMDNINRDVQEQKARLDRELGALKLKGQVLDARNARNLTDAADDHTRMLGRLQTLRQAYISRATAPGNAQMQAAVAHADQWFAQQIGQLATARRSEAVSIRENALQRSHAAYMAAKQRELTEKMHNQDIAARYDLARMSQEAALNKARLAAQGDKLKDVQGVPFSLGAVMVGSPLGENVQVHKEDAVKMRTVFEVANRRHDNLRRVKAALDDGSFYDRILAMDPELMSAARELGYTTAKELDPQGRLSDQDVKFATTISLGLDPSGSVIERGKFVAKLPEIQKMVDQAIRDLPDRVSNQASSYLDPNLVGQQARVAWAPQNMYNPKPVAPNLTEALGGMAVPTPKDVADFERRAAMEAANPMFRGRQLPDYDRDAVGNFARSVVGAGPASVEALAARAIKDYADTWNGPTRGDAATTKLAIEAEAKKAKALAEKAVKALNDTAVNKGVGMALSGKPEPTLKDIADLAARGDIPLTDAPDAIEKALEVAKKAYQDTPTFSWAKGKLRK